jgi:hypothetical protein
MFQSSVKTSVWLRPFVNYWTCVLVYFESMTLSNLDRFNRRSTAMLIKEEIPSTHESFDRSVEYNTHDSISIKIIDQTSMKTSLSLGTYLKHCIHTVAHSLYIHSWSLSSPVYLRNIDHRFMSSFSTGQSSWRRFIRQQIMLFIDVHTNKFHVSLCFSSEIVQRTHEVSNVYWKDSRPMHPWWSIWQWSIERSSITMKHSSMNDTVRTRNNSCSRHEDIRTDGMLLCLYEHDRQFE